MGGIVWPRMGKTGFCKPFGMPALAPLAFSLWPLCHARGLLAGIQCLSLLSLHFCGPAWKTPWIPD